MKSFLNRKRWNIEKTFCLILIIISFGIILSVHIKITRDEEIRYRNNINQETSKVFQYFSSDFQNMIKSGNSIFSSLWYSHLRNSAGIYDQEFHTIRRNEISQEIKNKLLSIKFAKNILVVTPDYVISKEGWFSHSQYQSYYNTINILNKDGKIQIGKNKNNIYPMLIPEPYAKINAGVVCVLLDGQKFDELLNSILPKPLEFCTVSMEGNYIYQFGEADKSLIFIQKKINSPDTVLQMGFPSYQSIYGLGNCISITVFLVFDLFFCIIISFFLSRIAAKPLKRLIRQFDGNMLEDPYQQIQLLVQRSFEQNEQLCQKTNYLNQSIQKIIQYTKKEVLLNMLTNSDFDFQNGLIDFYIPCINDGDPFFFIVLESFKDEDLHLVKKVKNRTKFAFSFPVWQKQICLFFWFEQISTAQEIQKNLLNVLNNIEKGDIHFSYSDILLEPEAIYENYCAITQEFEKTTKLTHELPLTLQMELVQCFYNSNIDKFLNVSRNSWNKYETNSFFSFLSRLTSEITGELPSDLIPYNKEDPWETYETQIKSLFQEIALLQKKDKDTSGKFILEYIVQHFCEQDMCLKKLTDIFCIHRTLISKMIKSYTNKSFSDYLLELRIEEAIKFLIHSDLAITTIAEKVGYTNYTTFKRAFIRMKGISPREYRENNQINHHENSTIIL